MLLTNLGRILIPWDTIHNKMQSFLHASKSQLKQASPTWPQSLNCFMSPLSLRCQIPRDCIFVWVCVLKILVEQLSSNQVHDKNVYTQNYQPLKNKLRSILEYKEIPAMSEMVKKNLCYCTCNSAHTHMKWNGFPLVHVHVCCSLTKWCFCDCVLALNATVGNSSRKYFSHLTTFSRATKSAEKLSSSTRSSRQFRD